MDISVLADYHSVKLVNTLDNIWETFYLYNLITFLYKIPNFDNYIQLTAEYDNLVLDDSIINTSFCGKKQT